MENKIVSGFEVVQDLIKLRWVPEILKSINLNNHRYSEISNSIPFMSNTELNRKLSILSDRNVIEKRFDENEGTSYYLNEFGADLVHIFYHLEDLENKYFVNA